MLLLRRDEPRKVFTGADAGDLDNRIKTLIDGLRMPRQCSELGGATPQAGEDPFYCLLQDDELIHEFRVTSDRLLLPPLPSEDERDVFAVVLVEIKSADGLDLATLSGGFYPDVFA